jgi:hypothetical protein
MPAHFVDTGREYDRDNSQDGFLQTLLAFDGGVALIHPVSPEVVGDARWDSGVRFNREFPVNSRLLQGKQNRRRRGIADG